MIPYTRFLKCHFDYMKKVKQAKNELQARKDDFLRSTESLIAHPETGEAFKTHLLEVRRNIQQGLGP